MFRAFDTNGDGYIDYAEFVNTIKGPLSPFRQEIVLRVFKMLDVAGCGLLTLSFV